MRHIKQSFSKIAKTYDEFSTIQTETAKQLIKNIPKCDPTTILDIGCGTGILTKGISKKFPAAIIDAVDISANMIQCLSFKPHQNINAIVMDYATTQVDKKYDLIVSNASLHWMNIPIALKRIKQQLNKKGIVLCSVFGHNTGNEFKQLLPLIGRQNPIITNQFLTKDDLTFYAKPLFSDVTIKTKLIKLTFNSVTDLIRTQKQTGVNIKLSPDGLWTPRQIQALDDLFKKGFGRVQFSYEVHYLRIG